jgi:hypothetical protein
MRPQGILTSCTLDDALRLGEDCASGAERVDIFPDLVTGLVRVDTRHAAGRVCEGLGKTLDRAKVHLESRRDDERVVREVAARSRADCVMPWVK